MHRHMNTNKYSPKHTNTNTHTNTHTLTHSHTHTQTHTHLYTHTHTRARAHTRTHAHTLKHLIISYISFIPGLNSLNKSVRRDQKLKAITIVMTCVIAQDSQTYFNTIFTGILI